MSQIVRLGVVDSTQRVAFALADRGAAEGTVVVADSQRAGRGRRGRVWHDEPGASLLCSILLRPRLAPARWPLFSIAAGVAAARALRHAAGVMAQLKWPNDVVVDGRKLAGILLESRLAPAPVVVVGIGVNVGQERFPGDLSGSATSVRLITGGAVPREPLLESLVGEVLAWCARLEREGFEPVREAWMEMSATLGTIVRGEGVTGRAVDLDAEGALVIDDGRVHHRLVAGEVMEDAASAARR